MDKSKKKTSSFHGIKNTKLNSKKKKATASFGSNSYDSTHIEPNTTHAHNGRNTQLKNTNPQDTLSINSDDSMFSIEFTYQDPKDLSLESAYFEDWLSQKPDPKEERRLKQKIQPQSKAKPSDNLEPKIQYGVANMEDLKLEYLPTAKLFRSDPPITTVYLKNNAMQMLPHDFFEQLPYLSWLDVRNNILTFIPHLIEPHNCLRVLLLQDNKIHYLSYSLVLASGLKHIGYEGNPISDPPQHIRKQGFERIMQYFKEQFEFTEEVVEDDGELTEALAEELSCEYEDNESIEDAGERESDSQILTSLSRKIKGSIESLNAYPSAETKNKFDARKANDATYTWDLWKEMPYEGPDNNIIFQSSLKELRKEALMKFNTEKNSLLQRMKTMESMEAWRRKRTRPIRPNTAMCNYDGLKHPFGTYADEQPECSISDTRIPPKTSALFQEEILKHRQKLTELVSAPLSNVEMALECLKEVEGVKRQLNELRQTLGHGSNSVPPFSTQN